MANQKRNAFEVKTIRSPSAKWFTLENFMLEKIPDKFTLADFQRKQNTAHVYRIVESIVNNTFYDNVIRCVKLKDGRYEVIDGQHRLKALWILFKQYGIRNYTIVMQLFKNDEAREVFRKINSGKKLTNADHLKTLDDGSYDFFEELRGVCTHTNNKTTNTYMGALNSIYYAKTNQARSIKVYDLEELLEKITSDELAHVYRESMAMKTVYDKTKSPRTFSLSLSKALLRIGISENFTRNDYASVLLRCLDRNDIMNLAIERFTQTETELNKLVKEVWESIKV